MNPQPVMSVLPAYVGTRDGRRVAFTPCDRGIWHLTRIADTVEVGAVIRVGVACGHFAQISPTPFRTAWRCRVHGVANLISVEYAAEMIKPSWQ